MSMTSLRSSLVFDHIAIVARSLEEGADYIRDTLNIDMPSGGAHPRMGTHNLLLSLGPNCFLEVIAVDPNAKPPARPRWFGLDTFDAKPRIGAWVLGATDIHAALDGQQGTSGPVIEMTRGDLCWQMSVRDDGEVPMSGAFPKILQWPVGPHVAAKMEGRGCSFVSLTIAHPQADAILSWLDRKIDDPRIELKSDETRMTAKIMTPSGLKLLS